MNNHQNAIFRSFDNFFSDIQVFRRARVVLVFFWQGLKKSSSCQKLNFVNHSSLYKNLIKILYLLYLPNLLLAADKPDLFLLKTYDETKSVVGWVMSEKLDGIRGFWDGKQLLTRSGQKIAVPDWFIIHYPPFSIDGELWTKRADFEEIGSIVRRKIPDERWRKITHQIFEVPDQQGGLLDRLAILRDYLKTQANSPIRIIKQYPINQQNQVKRFLQDVTHKGGEGVVVRDPNTAYQTGRLNSALKVKKYLDMECVVENIVPGKGKYVGKMGSLLCKTKKGMLVKVGSGFRDIQRENPPPIGTVITFKYFGLTKKGKPKYPVFLRIRLVR